MSRDDGRVGDDIDFFVSYTGVDERWAEWIAWQLEAAGEGWVVKLQKWDFRAGNNFVVEMQAASAAAKHTIAVLSPAYFGSGMATAEWAAAFVHDAKGTERRLIPVRVLDCKPPGLLSAIVYVDLVDKRDEASAKAALLSGIRDGRRKPDGAPTWPGYSSPLAGAVSVRAPRFPGDLPRVFAVPFPQNPYFRGRAAALAALRQALAGGGATAVTQPQAIHGLGGVGKTQLAVAHAYAHAADYDAVLWAAADTPATLRSSLAALAVPLELPEREAAEEAAQVAAVERWLGTNRRWLLVLDNADTPEAAAAVVTASPKLRAGHVIVTSRRDAWPIGFGDVRVDVLEESAAVDLLLARAGGLDSEDDAHAVAAAVGCLPLALEQAAAYVKRRRIRFAAYLEDFKTARSRVLAHPAEGGTGYRETVATTWLVTQSHLGSEARAVLRLGSFLAAAPIPRGLWACDAKAFLDAVARVAAASPELQDVSEAAERGMVELADYSLATLTPETISFHRLVTTVERQQLAASARDVWLKLTLQLLATAVAREPGDVRNWPTWEPLAPHLAEAVAEADVAGIAVPTSELMNKLGVFFMNRARWSAAEPLYRRALAIDETSFGSHHPTVAIRLNNLALLLKATNRLTEAEPAFRRALAIDEGFFGSDHPSVAIRLSNLAGLLHVTNRSSEAEILLRRALAIDETFLGPDHPNVAIRLNNLTNILHETSRFAEAEPLLRRVLTIDEAFFGPEHPNVALDLNSLGALLKATNRLLEAETLFRRAVAIDETSLGPAHPTLASSLNNLAITLQATERLAEAEALLRRAVAIDVASLGPDHPHVARDLTNLALVLEATNRLVEAEDLFRRALVIDEASFGPHHPSVAIGLHGIGGLLQVTGRPVEAEPLFRRAVTILTRFASRTGHEHPNAAIVLGNYRRVLALLGLNDVAADARIRSAEREAGASED